MATNWNERDRYRSSEMSRPSGGQLDRGGNSPFGSERGSQSEDRDYYSREQGSRGRDSESYYSNDRGSRTPDYSGLRDGRSQGSQNSQSYQGPSYGGNMSDRESSRYQSSSYPDRESSRQQSRDFDRDRLIERGSNQYGSNNNSDIYYGRGNFEDNLNSYNVSGYSPSSYDGRGSQSFNAYGSSSRSSFGGSNSDNYSTYGRDNNFGSSSIQQMRRSFAGKGPKGWTRSDDRIKEQVCDALERDHHIDASDIEVDVQQGIVILRGNVEDRRTKRLAEDCVEHLSGVKDVRNELSVNASFFEQAKEVLTGESPSEKRAGDSAMSAAPKTSRSSR